MNTPSAEPVCLPPDLHPHAPRVMPPPLSCDCHAHVIGPRSRYAFVADRSYTPPDALLTDYTRLLRTLGLQRTVLVQPSMHGTDNAAMMEAIAQLEQASLQARGVAVIASDAPDAVIEELHAGGVRGVRLNLIYSGGGLGMDDARLIAPRLKAMGWHLEVLLDVAAQPEAVGRLEALGVPLVVAHMGHPSPLTQPHDKGFRNLQAALRQGRTWVKASAPYRSSLDEPPYEDVHALAHTLLEAAPAQVVWGSDWPHTLCRSPMPNDGALLDLLHDWTGGDDALLQQVLVDTPARLYGFDQGPH